MHSSELLSTTSLLSQQAYRDAEAKLNKIRHEILPQLVAELERVEESMGLKPNILVGPAIIKMERYYSQLATYVDGIVTHVNNAPESHIEQMDEGFYKRKVFDVLHLVRGDKSEKLVVTPRLSVMRDDGFMANVLERQSKRLAETELESRDDSKLSAAQRFFEKLGNYTPELHLWSLANIPSIEKEELLLDYKQIQPHFAALWPTIDKLIVNALSKRNDSGWLARVYNSEYKQMYGADHFTQILACKDSVIIDIKQSIKQASFKAKLIQKAAAVREASFYEAQGKKIHFNPDVEPFVPLVVAVETPTGAEPSSEVFHQKSIETGIQLHELYLAKDGLNAFFKRLSVKFQHNPKFSALNDDDKTFLQRAYKKFQPHVLAKKEGDLNRQILDALTFQKSIKPLPVLELLLMKEDVNTDLDLLISKSIQDQKDYTKQEKATKIEELRTTPIVAMGSQLEKKTLFGAMVGLKLSKTIDDFIRVQLPLMLKEKLDPGIFERLSFDKLPFLDLHKESKDVVMYKQLINSLYYMQQSLAHLEKAENGYYVFEHTQYLYSFLHVVDSLVDSKNMLVEATGNPGLAVIIKDALQILQPLQNLPIIGEYLRASPAVSPKVQEPKRDIVAVWSEQLDILERAKSANLFVTAKPIVQVSPQIPPSIAPVSEARYLQVIAEQLYRIPQHLQAFNLKILRVESKTTLKAKIKEEEMIKAKIKTFVDLLGGLSIGPGSLQKILLSVSAANTQLSLIGKESRSLAMGVLTATMGQTIVVIADNTELHLGLKPGTLSTNVCDQFNAFYTTLISHLPFKDDQEDLRRLTSTASVDARIKNVERQREALLVNNEANEVEASIFGGPYTVNLIYKELDTLASRAPLIKEEILALYDKLSAYLPNQVGVIQFRKYLTLIDDEASLRQVVLDLQEAKDHVEDPLGSFEKLEAHYMYGDFRRVEDQEKFLRYYQEIQPFLNQIDPHYDLIKFLRKLNTPDGFETALKEIIDLEPKLRELVAGKAQVNIGKLQQCNRRLDYLNAQRAQEIVSAKMRLDHFKDMVFSNYLHANVLSQFDKALGPYSDVFFAKISVEIIAQQNDILKDITIAEDIEAVISTKIDAIQGEIMKKHLIKQQYATYADLNSSLEKIKTLNIILGDMEKDVSSQSDVASPICQAKLAEIRKLQAILNGTESPDKRLSDIKARGMKNECKDILLKSTDNIFVRFFKSILSFIFRWKSNEVKAVDLFKKELEDITPTSSEVKIKPAPALLAPSPTKTPVSELEHHELVTEDVFFDAVDTPAVVDPVDVEEDKDDDIFCDCEENSAIDNGPKAGL